MFRVVRAATRQVRQAGWAVRGVGRAPAAVCGVDTVASAYVGRRGLHTAPCVSQKAKRASKKKKKGGAQQRGPDKLYYTRVELPKHQMLITDEAASTVTEADSDEVSQANSGASWTPSSRRAGVVTLKCGMTADWDTWGQRHPLTVLKLEDVQVTQVKGQDKHSITSVQVGGGEAKPKNVTKPLAGHFEAAGVDAKLKLSEFPVSEDAVLPVGTPITARHFVPGQFVDVTATSVGKGFQGPMKRWGFGGQKASHGTTKAHRSHGSTGSSQNPGRVFKGKKMAGRMGGKTVTVEGLQVYKIDVKRNLVYLRGSVPGHAGAYVRVRDSLRKPLSSPPPFPTYMQTAVDAERQRRWELDDYDSPAQVLEKRQTGETFELEPAFELLMPPQAWDPFGIHDWEEPTMD